MRVGRGARAESELIVTQRAGLERKEWFPFQRLAVTALAALAAALFGWALFTGEGLLPDRPVWWIPLAVIFGSVAVSVPLAILLVRPAPVSGRPLEPARGRASGPDRGWHPARGVVVEQRSTGSDRGKPLELDGRSSRPGADRAEPAAVQLVLPVGQPAGGAPPAGQWWDRGAPAPAADTHAITPARPVPRDLAALRDAARVVQCPRCGAFRIDVRHTSAGYAFRCRVDGHEWTWQPGTAWPATVVASHRRKRPPTAGPH